MNDVNDINSINNISTIRNVQPGPCDCRQLFTYGFVVFLGFLFLGPLLSCESEQQEKRHSLAAWSEVLDNNPPEKGNASHRSNALVKLDAIFQSTALSGVEGYFDIGGPEHTPETNRIRGLYLKRLDRALAEIAKSQPEEGVRLWQLYNMGYIVQNADGIRVGFDVIAGLNWYNWRWEISDDLIRRICENMDILFITHWLDHHKDRRHTHTDHFDTLIVKKMLAMEKPVVVPAALAEEAFAGDSKFGLTAAEKKQLVYMKADEVLRFPFGKKTISVRAGKGAHVYQDNDQAGTPLLAYRVLFPGGISVTHTGDLDYTKGVPKAVAANVDIAILHAGGVSPEYAGGIRDDVKAFLQGLGYFQPRPSLVIPGHLAELGHGVNAGRESYRMALAIQNNVSNDCRIPVLFWGEKVHYPE